MSNKKKTNELADVGFETLWNKEETQEILKSNFLNSELFVYKEVMFYFYLQGVFDDAKRVNEILKSLCDSNKAREVRGTLGIKL